jgi:hypothetical protein
VVEVFGRLGLICQGGIKILELLSKSNHLLARDVSFGITSIKVVVNQYRKEIHNYPSLNIC